MGTVNKIAALERLDKSFTPHHPIYLPEFLAGRQELLYKTNDAANTEGLHVILYGERGIGKSSVARVIGYRLQEPDRKDGRRAVFVSCTSEEDYSSIWNKAFQEIYVSEKQWGFGQLETIRITGRMDYGDKITQPNDVRLIVQSFPNPTAFIFDEFDRIPKEGNVQRLMSDTIKLFADYNVMSTVILVGVAESIADLLQEHQSISRNIAQIRVDQMTVDELSEIIQNGFKNAVLEYENDLDSRIAELSQGYPHYTHLLGLWSGRVAIENEHNKVSYTDLETAIPRALEKVTGGAGQEYEKAVESSWPDNLFRAVLLACAMANKDSLGRFAASDLRDPLKQILNRDYRTVSYQGHLAKFCEQKRGPILKRTGARKRYRWQFINPQLIPYIRLQSIKDGLLTN